VRAGALFNHYQPQVELASGAVLAVEALARWSEPQGTIFPDRFIETAEQHGLIDELTIGVLRRALQQARTWRERGLELRVSVNVSMANLVALDFPDVVAAEAAAHGVPTASLLLEVTESRLMADPRAPLEILTRLRLKGVGLAIDDFGTGHSSLAQLRDLPFDELKIDRGFVHGAHADRSLRAILEASVRLARQMGMRTVAEGVEDADDWAVVRDAGCDAAQGWFMGRAMAPDAVPAWIQGWQERREELSASPASIPGALDMRQSSTRRRPR
jgi:EAL domain-containing protein (putative c-di-GMP-specific phosphodiesterase class I)